MFARVVGVNFGKYTAPLADPTCVVRLSSLPSTDRDSENKPRSGMLRSSGMVGLSTTLSRVLGLVRDVVIARLVGASGAADAFFVAFKLPNFFRRLFAEGAFNTAFVPVLSDYRRNRSLAEVRALINRTAAVLGAVLSLVTILVVLFPSAVMAVYGMGYLNDPFRFDLASDLLRWTFPYLLLISLTGLAGSILNTYDRFAVPALTPVFLNLCLILAALWIAPGLDQPVFALAWAVLAAGVIQLLFQLPFLARIHLLPRPVLDWTDPGVRRIFKLMIPAMFGVSVSQINLLLDTILATFLPAGSVSWLYYSDRLMELPLGVFGVAIATVALPNLSRQRFETDPQQFALMLQWAVRLILLISLPASLALMLLAEPILATLFQYGVMSQSDVQMASYSLIAYAVGLVAFMLVKVLATGYFAHEDTMTPVRIGIIAMAVNMLLNLIFVAIFYFGYGIGHVGLALATSVSALLNAILLFRGLRSQNRIPALRESFRFIAQLLAALLVMGALLLLLTALWNDWYQWGVFDRVWRLTLICGAGGLVYFLTLTFTGMRWQQFRMRSSSY